MDLRNSFWAILLSFVLLFLPTQVFAHGLGQSFANEEGDYLVEFEYDALEVTSDESVPYVFRILQKQDDSPVNFESLLVRFVEKEGNATYLVARLAEDALLEGAARTTLLLPQGEYEVELNFQDEEGETFAESTFDHTVQAGEAQGSFSGSNPPVRLLGGLVGGLVLGFLGTKLLTKGSSGTTKDKKKK